MKVLIFSHEFPPALGGAGVVAYQNACLLAQRGHEVTVLTSESCRASELGLKFNTVTVPKKLKLWFLFYRFSVDFDSFDIILLNDPAAIYVAGLFFSNKVFQKSIAFLHGSEPENIYIEPRFSLRLLRYEKFYSKGLLSVKSICAVSKFMKSKFLDMTGLLELESKIFVSYAGIDHSIFYFDSSSTIRDDLSISSSSTVMLSVSRVVEGKGYNSLLSIFHRLESAQDLYWVIVGDGSYINFLRKEVGRLGLSHKVVFAGQVGRELLKAYYSMADVFVLLSEYEESFGLVYLEAQACGLPVIALDRGGVAEAICPEASFVVPNCEQAYQLLLERKYQEVSSESLREFSREFSSELFIERVVSHVT